MNRYLMILLTTAGACALQAQSNPLSTEAKQAYNGIKNNLTKMAEKMPEENYAFKPTPDIRSFGELVGHIADAQTRICSTVNGQPKQAGAGSKTSKADLVTALKASFAECDKAYDALTDATGAEMIKGPRGERSKLGTLYGNVVHDNEEYGYMSVYLRLKGVVPPSSEKR
jgi:uncharacterized damage-inducible protein DinB